MPNYTINPETLVLEGSRPANMFSISPRGGGQSIWLPNPERDSAKGLVATLVDSARNTKGVVTAQKICRDQDKVELAWSLLTVEEWETLLEFWDKNFYFNLTYYSPVKHTRITRVFYIGDRTYRPWNIDSEGIPTGYVECAANMTDTGVTE